MYDLRAEPWLPWRLRNGTVEWGTIARVVDRMASDEAVVGLAAPRPDFETATLEFLAGLLSVAMRPADDEEWEQQWDAPPSMASLQSQLDALPPAFDLDEPSGPAFLQDFAPADVLGKGTIPVERLLIDTPGVQSDELNATLFVKPGRFEAFSRPMAAMALITMQSYAPAGGAGHRTSMRGGGPLTTLVEPRSDPLTEPLWHQLWFNVETVAQWKRRASQWSDAPAALFPWLAPCRTSEKSSSPVTPEGIHPAQAYFATPRRIRLVFGTEVAPCGLTGRVDARPVVGFAMRNYGVNYAQWRHPFSPYYLTKGEWLPMHPQPSGFQWKDWANLVLAATGHDREPATIVVDAPDRARAVGVTTPTVRLLGYDMDKMKARGWMDARVPLFPLITAAEREFMLLLARELASAVTISSSVLGYAISSALYERPDDAGSAADPYRQQLWARTEALFFRTLRDAYRAGLGVESVSEARRLFHEPLQACVMHLFDEAAPLGPAPVMAIRRIVRSRQGLTLSMAGYGKAGSGIAEALNLVPVPSARRKPKAGVKA
ncbi:MAG TPA: type I-E CRISPR-associated protein Cse1/CasA [Gemmatimonas sp.]|uniref:type I-E CRISPR-associated protein Cse1/CasA n=1 Tax=Gemmatimonas sp. TaxID=1962908 RepID=UPI002ED9F4C2